jgi:hypothetical protein
MDEVGINRLSDVRSRGVRMAVCGVAGATILGFVGAAVYGWLDSAKGQMVEGATSGACLGAFVGGVVGLITGSLTRETLWRTIRWAAAAGLLGAAFGILHYNINFRSRLGVRSPEEIFGDTMSGIFMGLTFGGILGAGICTVLAEVRQLVEESRSRIEMLRYVYGLDHPLPPGPRVSTGGSQRGGPVSLPRNQVEK